MPPVSAESAAAPQQDLVKISWQVLTPLMVALMACGVESTDLNGAGDDSGIQQNQPALPSDNDILAMVYDSSYSVPQGFFADERVSTSRSYSVYHVKDASQSYELCSNRFAEAGAWEEADNDSRSVHGFFVGSYENERYFEFIRELSFDQDIGNINDLTSPGFARVFKCTNTNRNGVDRALLNGYAGTLSLRPLTASEVRTFTEYLWQFTFFPVARKKVLESFASQTSQALQQTLLLAFSINQGSERCDLIEVSSWEFSADRKSGELTKRFETVHSFEARFENGTATICD